MDEEKLHYFLFSFVGGGNTYARVTMGWPDNKVTESRLLEARKAVLDNKACPLAVSYLGYMTRAEATS
jgi:hypothetical protein